jgi:hypothetical protein
MPGGMDRGEGEEGNSYTPTRLAITARRKSHARYEPAWSAHCRLFLFFSFSFLFNFLFYSIFYDSEFCFGSKNV